MAQEHGAFGEGSWEQNIVSFLLGFRPRLVREKRKDVEWSSSDGLDGLNKVTKVQGMVCKSWGMVEICVVWCVRDWLENIYGEMGERECRR